jgi:hypothetical protein
VTMIDAGFGMPTNCARAAPKGTNVATTNATDNSRRETPSSRLTHHKTETAKADFE